MFRVTAEHTENPKEKMILDIKVNADNEVIPMTIFGYAEEGYNDSEKWPFIIEPNKPSSKINWGAGFNDHQSTINIIGKELCKNNYFTRFDKEPGNPSSDEYTYRIINIEPL